MAQLSHVPRMMTMIDNPEKTMALLSALKAAVPFDADMTHELAETLAVKHGSVSCILYHAVTDVFYAGDEGGIMCRIAATDGASNFVVSLTHLRLPRLLPFAPAALAYQRHRVKKIKKQSQI